MDKEQPKKPLCPQCRQPTLVLQGTKDDPRIRPALDGKNFFIPMRCAKCGINLEIKVAGETLENPDDEY